MSSAEDGPDPSKLPPVAAPPSHPAIDPTATGMLEGRPVFEVDIAALADKAWRRPGSDISDWFNYGFDEISWEAYCYRRRELGDLAAVLKTNVVVRTFLYMDVHCVAYWWMQNFSGMPEDQLTQLPPELRTMVMTGATAMMANGGAPMMQSGMNPMMAPEMGNMSMGPQMMDPMMAGMGGEMGMDGVGVGVGVGAPQQGQGGPMPDQMGAGVEGFVPQAGMGVGMGMPEYGIQVCYHLLDTSETGLTKSCRTRAECNRCNNSNSNSSNSSSNKCSRSSFSNSRCSSSSYNSNTCIKTWRPPSHRRLP